MRSKRAMLASLLIVPLVALTPIADDYLRAASLLTRLTQPRSENWLATYRVHTVSETQESFNTPQGSISYRLYQPKGMTNAPAMVVIHGVHHLGMNEPRLVAFSRAIAQSGVTVMTPEVPRIADYRVTSASIDVIGLAAAHLHSEIGKPVGLFGLSFSGGLALIAAADHRFRNDISSVTAVGAHHDMARVARFFATDVTTLPNGRQVRARAHEYGPLVLIYAHPEEFFPANDVEAARRVLRILLHEENVNAAREADVTLSKQGRAIMERIFQQDRDFFTPQVLEYIEKHQDEMASVSPHGKLRGLHVPVLLLHGSADDIIPPSETEWLSREVPPEHLENVLITPLLSHVDVGSDEAWRERAAVLHFIVEMLDSAE